ncbi:Hypothetical predicted protein [Paramuricea clavata]|uniref:Uncharacterized protein n=1 Tax=Paramuricea clavata TaxID=317549 RepID=A0A7D9L541_PARCT|nr:Hypothetical predicted protein [Paramuricea clavata]
MAIPRYHGRRQADIAMMGALHMEGKMHVMAGKLLHDSGWTTILSQTEVLSSGCAQSALNEHHINRTRYAHQVYLISLSLLLKQSAYSEYCESVLGPPESFEMWNQHSLDLPQFKFWSTIIELELLMARFVRSLREGDFLLYVQACDELCAWFHAMDHKNYARWLPGNFVVQKSAKRFSLIAKDQAHEQSNKSLQAHGGAVEFYENPEALALFILPRPAFARIVEEFEAVYDPPPSSTAHYEEGHNLQELVAFDTQNVMEKVVVTSLSQIHAVGQALHAAYVTERLEKASVPISDTIKRNNMFIFPNRPDPKTKGNEDNCTQKQNMTLITQLFLSLQSRPDADMMEFFRFEIKEDH